MEFSLHEFGSSSIAVALFFYDHVYCSGLTGSLLSGSLAESLRFLVPFPAHLLLSPLNLLSCVQFRAGSSQTGLYCCCTTASGFIYVSSLAFVIAKSFPVPCLKCAASE